jgi:ketosteroid isomerase-like protein
MKTEWLLCVLLFFPCGVHARGKPVLPEGQNRCSEAADESAIRKIPEEWKRNYNAGNATGVAALYTEAAYYLTQHFVTGIVEGRARIQAYVQRGVDARYHIDSIEILATGCSGEMAYVVDRYTANNAGQTAVGVNLVVLRKIRGRWQIVAHEAAVPDAATAVQRLDAPKPR